MTSLAAGGTFYIAVESEDEFFTRSGLSNTAGNSARAQVDVTPPAAVLNTCSITAGTHWPGSGIRPTYFKYWEYPPPAKKDAMDFNAGRGLPGEIAFQITECNPVTRGIPKLIRCT